MNSQVISDTDMVLFELEMLGVKSPVDVSVIEQLEMAGLSVNQIVQYIVDEEWKHD